MGAALPAAVPIHPEPVQLAFVMRAVSRIQRFKGPAPERALWRERFDLLIQQCEAFGVRHVKIPGGRPVSLTACHAVCWTLYARSTDNGKVRGFSTAVLARDCGLMDPRTFRETIRALTFAGILRAKRENRRRPMSYAMTVGGMDWPAARIQVGVRSEWEDHRAAIERAQQRLFAVEEAAAPVFVAPAAPAPAPAGPPVPSWAAAEPEHYLRICDHSGRPPSRDEWRRACELRAVGSV